MRGSLKSALTDDRLALAFRHLITGSNYAYKNLFRNALDAYPLATPGCFSDMRSSIADGSYVPTHATKVFLPKRGGIQRLYSLLSVQDQVLYQALAIEIAEKLAPIAKSRYCTSVFGNMYQGTGSDFFYVHYPKAYSWFTNARKKALEDGFTHVATFDLTAFFDSIDHRVLQHRLGQIGLDEAFCELLCKCLSKWTACVTDPPIYQGHGIPQGPLSSGMIAEVVLSYFDDKSPADGNADVRYLRYVDDIELFSRTEQSLREELLQLDYRSKEIGLFPQSAKIDIREVKDIQSEVMRVVSTDIAERQKESPDQARLKRRLMELTSQLKVRSKDKSAFAYVLAGYRYESQMACRLLEILEKQPELFQPMMLYLSRAKRLSPRVTLRLIERTRKPQLYPAVPAEALRLLADAGHASLAAEVRAAARLVLSSKAAQDSHDLREAAMRAMLSGVPVWGENRARLLSERNWWVQSSITGFLAPHHAPSSESYAKLVNRMLRKSESPALVAARLAGMHSVSIDPNREAIPRIAQRSLKAQSLIGRLRENRTPIEDAMIATLGNAVAEINWRRILGIRYRDMIPAVVDWAGVYSTNPTEWIMIGDTINDVVLDVLFKADAAIGSYQLGNIGGVLNKPTSRLATTYSLMYAAADEVHRLRLQARPAHSVTSATQRPTRRITHAERKTPRQLLARGYAEIWIAVFSTIP